MANCRTCNTSGLHWQKSRVGSFYLTNSEIRSDFHSKTCSGQVSSTKQEDSGNKAEADLAEQEMTNNAPVAAAPVAAPDQPKAMSEKPSSGPAKGFYRCVTCGDSEIRVIVPAKPQKCMCGSIMRFSSRV
jgi:hypothetical protein